MRYRVPDHVKDDVSFADYEYTSIISKCDGLIQTKLKELILHCYNNALLEFSMKNLRHRTGYTEPNLDTFIKLIFSFSFAKLHRGDKSKAREIFLEELAKLDSYESNVRSKIQT